jgi:hypothetical protein
VEFQAVVNSAGPKREFNLLPAYSVGLLAFLGAMMVAGEIYAAARSTARNPAVIPVFAFLPFALWMPFAHISTVVRELQKRVESREAGDLHPDQAKVG